MMADVGDAEFGTIVGRISPARTERTMALVFGVIMDAAPNNEGPSAPEHKHDGGDSPSPSEMLTAIVSWLRHYWDAPREKSKGTEIATVILTFVIAVMAFWSAWIFQGQLAEMQKQRARPWMSAVGPIKVVKPLSFSGPRPTVTIEYTVKNSGTSTAVGQQSTNGLYIGPMPSSEEVEKRSPCRTTTYDPRGGGTLIVPGDSYTVGPMELPAANGDWQSLTYANGKTSAWLDICIQYMDEFNVPRATNMVWFYVSQGEAAFVPAARIDGEFHMLGVGRHAN